MARLSFLPAAAFALLCGFALLSGDAGASPLTASGTLCKPLFISSYSYPNPNTAIGFTNTGSGTGTVGCIVPMDATALGSTVTFKLRVLDNSTTQGFSCTPYVVNQNGSIVVSGAARTTTASATGTVTLGGSTPWTVSVTGNVNTNLYAIQCTMPGNNSRIYTARVE